EVTLVTPGTPMTTGTNAANLYQPINLHANTPAMRFTVPSAIKLGAGESVQVELLPSKTGAKARTVVTFEAMNDPSGNFQQFQAVDCNQFSQSAGTGRAEVALEIEVPASATLPDGRARLFKRSGSRLEVVSEDPLRAATGVARIRLSPDNDVTGDRHAASCNYDERTQPIQEKIKLTLENK